MEKVIKKIKGVNIIFLKTKKFKSICGGLFFKSLVTERKMSSYTLIRKLLLRSTKKFDTERKLNINVLENYSPYYSNGTTRIGSYIINSFCFETLNDKYTEAGNLKKVIDTFNEIVFNPNASNGEFNKKEYDFCYKREITDLDKIKESQRNYAYYRLASFFNKKKAYSYYENKEMLASLNAKEVYNDYLDMINNSEVTLVIAGDINEDYVLANSIIDNISSSKKIDGSLIISNDDEKDELKEIIEDGEGTENILNIVCYLKGLSEYELYYVMPIYRYLLGGSGNSRLFNEVREKNSLAYYIYASYDKDDNMMEVTTGIKKEDYDKTVDLIKKELGNMDNISDAELTSAKKYLISSIITSQDYLGSLMSRCYNEDLFSYPPIDEFIKKINEVTISDIKKVSKKIYPSICYFLKGSDTDE